MPHTSGLFRLYISRLIAFIAGLLFIGSFPSSNYAQSIQGSVVGTVRDSGGAVVPGAAVTLTNLGEGTVRNTVTDGSGSFQFIDTKAGQYSIQVTANGFQKWTATNLSLAARQDLRVDAALPVGNVQQQVNVSGDALSAINTEDPTISGVYNSADVANLPVNTRASASGTSALNIIGTLPGVQADHGSFSLQGGLPFQTEVSVDGITVQGANSNSPIADAFPSSESISELRTDGALNNAEFGQPGEVTVVTKAGTNTIHGSAFW